jgi:uncharacterized protein YndB with AHSA1/START domain
MIIERLLWNRATWSLVAAVALAVSPATAAERSWRDFKDVSNSSFVEPGGDRSLQLSVEVPATPHEVFTAFTTSEGFSSWAVPVAKIDFRIGGFIEASYDPHAKPGDPGNIRNEIVAYVPDRLLVIRNAQAPPGFADPELFRRTVTIIELVSLSPRLTQVTLTNAGYGAGERFDALYKNFEWGDAYTLEELRRRFETGPVDWSAREAQQKAKAAAAKVEGSR